MPATRSLPLLPPANSLSVESDSVLKRYLMRSCLSSPVSAFCRSAGTRATAQPCISHIAGYFVRVDFILRVAGIRFLLLPVPSRGTRDSDFC